MLVLGREVDQKGSLYPAISTALGTKSKDAVKQESTPTPDSTPAISVTPTPTPTPTPSPFVTPNPTPTILPKNGVKEITNNNELAKPEQKADPIVTSPTKPAADIRVLILGDSFMALGGGIGNPLERDLLFYKDIEVNRFGKVSSGLSQPNFFNWNIEAAKLIAQYNPNVAIIMLGANDNQNLKTAAGKFIWYGNPGWNEEYAKRLNTFLQIFEDNKITVFWVGIPIMRDAEFSNEMNNLNSIYEKEIQNYKNMYFISTWKLLVDESGNYTDYLPDANGQLRLARVRDGIHVQYFAGGIISKEIISRMSEVIKLELK